jgi:hypothetical protein
MKAKNAEQMLKESLKLAGIKTSKMPVNVGINAYNYVSESAEFDHKGSQLVMEAALMESVFGKIANFFKSDYKDVKYAFFANKTGDVMTVVGNSGKFEVVELIGSKARSNKFANSSDLTKFLAVKIAQGFELKKKQLDIKGVMKQIGKGLLAIMGIIAFGFGAYYLVSAYGAAAVTMGLKVPSFLGNIMDKITGAGVEPEMVTKELDIPLRDLKTALNILSVQRNAEFEALRLEIPKSMLDELNDNILSIRAGLLDMAAEGTLTPERLRAAEIEVLELKSAYNASSVSAQAKEFYNNVLAGFGKLIGDAKDSIQDYKSSIQSQIPPDAMGSSIPKTAVRFDDTSSQVSNAVKSVATNVTDTTWITRIASDATKIATMIAKEQAMRNAGKPVTPNTTLDDVMVGP